MARKSPQITYGHLCQPKSTLCCHILKICDLVDEVEYEDDGDVPLDVSPVHRVLSADLMIILRIIT